MKLTDRQVRNADSAGRKQRKLFDGGGLHLMLTDKGGKYWRFRYRFRGRDCLLSLGTYPQISLKQVRQLHRDAQTLLHQGIDPHAQKMRQRREARQAARQTASFAHFARQWYEGRKNSYTNAKAAQQVINLAAVRIPADWRTGDHGTHHGGHHCRSCPPHRNKARDR